MKAKSAGIVDTNTAYSAEALQRDIQGIKIRYPFIETGVAGKSAMGRNIDFLRLGKGGHQVLYTAAIHALEWITGLMLMKFTEDFSAACAQGLPLGGYSPRDISRSSSIYIVPMVNPDGVDLVLNGLQASNPNYYDLISWNRGSKDFSAAWQANNNGVDLNHNFNAAWEESKEAADVLGITGPGPTRYPGAYPESEPESAALADFTRSHDFTLVLAYHSQGGEIYWNFAGLEPPESRMIGEQFAKLSGYSLAEATGITSYAGFKDWFIKEFGRPGYTIEVGHGKNPLPISQFGDIYAHNLPLMMRAAVIKDFN